MTATTLDPSLERSRPHFHLSTRYRLVGIGVFAVLLAVFTLTQALNSLAIARSLLNQIATVNSLNVDAAEFALAHVSATTQASANWLMLASQERATPIFANFEQFRDQMFVLRGNLPTAVEQETYAAVEQNTYDAFWMHLGNMWNTTVREDALAAYFAADQVLTEQIIPLLSQIEDRNFGQMVAQQEQAQQTILTQVLLFAVPAVGLCLVLTGLSFWLRRTVRRYLSPGVDLALVAAWLAAIVIGTTLLNVPEQLRVMVVDSYRSISASARILVDANLAERAESNALLEPDNARRWDAMYEGYMETVALRMCGQPNCAEAGSFAAVGTSDTADETVVRSARALSPENAARIGNVIPLMGNITFVGEVSTIERMRVAYLDYQHTHQQLRALIESGNVAEATALDLENEGQSVFTAFTQAVEDERAINREVFDRVWREQEAVITHAQTFYAFGLLIFIMVSVVVGVYHRFREL